MYFRPRHIKSLLGMVVVRNQFLGINSLYIKFCATNTQDTELSETVLATAFVLSSKNTYDPKRYCTFKEAAHKQPDRFPGATRSLSEFGVADY